MAKLISEKCMDNTRDANDEVARSFPVRASHFWVAAVCALGFFLAGVVSFVVMWREGQIFMGAAFTGFYVLIALLSVWLLVFARRYRLTVTERGVTEKGWLSESRVDPVDRIVWRGTLGRVEVHGASPRISIRFTSFSREHRRELLASLREHLQANTQAGWEEFERRLLKPNPQLENSQRLFRIATGIVLAAFAVFFGYLSFLQGDSKYVALVCGNILAAALMLRPRVESSAAAPFDLL